MRFMLLFFYVCLLELRQYKTDFIQSKIIPISKLPRFFTTYTARGKGVNFKIGIIFNWIESFLYCLDLNTIWSSFQLSFLWEFKFKFTRFRCHQSSIGSFWKSALISNTLYITNRKWRHLLQKSKYNISKFEFLFLLGLAE